MKKLFLISLIIVQSCIAFAQNCCVNDTIVREIQFPLTEQDTKPVFYYFNEEWIPGADLVCVSPDSIQKMEVKNDEYGNRALFLTVSPEYVAQVKEKLHGIFINLDPTCEFPGGNGKLKEWIDENIRIPDGFKGSERVFVKITIHPDGSVNDPKIIRNPSKNEAVNEEALRLVRALPKFRVRFATPRKHNLYYTIPITFKEPGVIWIRGDEKSISNTNVVESEIFHEPEQIPYYINGGGEGLLNDLYTAMLKTAPVTQDCVKGRALVKFIVSEDGIIDPNSIEILRNKSVPEDYMKAAIEAIKKLGKFEPGKMNGTPIKVWFNLPVIYPIPLDKIEPSK